MEFTKRDFKKPELTDPADIRDLNENSDSLEEHLNAITGYDYGKTIILGTDAVEINKIHLNKIPADPDFGKYFLILTGSTWDTSTKEEYDMKNNPSLEDKLPKGVGLSPEYDTAKKIEDKIEGLLSVKEFVVFDGEGGVDIKSSFGINSVVRNGTGDYTVTFTNTINENALLDISVYLEEAPGRVNAYYDIQSITSNTITFKSGAWINSNSAFNYDSKKVSLSLTY